MSSAPTLRAGASGFAYPEWKGSFYLAEIGADEMLAWYGERLPTVEINNTFYRNPKREVVARWAEATPPDFRFAIKASRRITHDGRLKAAEVADTVKFLYGNLAALGDKLAAVLFQTPPNLKKDLARLEAFVALLPQGHRAAFEFRHDSWLDDEVYAVLKSADAALVLSEREDASAPPLVETTNRGYLRLRLETYSDADLEAWARRIAATGWREACVYFMHEPAAPGYAIRLMQACGQAAGAG